MKLGEEVPFVTGVSLAGRGELQSPRTYNVIAGSYLSVNAIAGSVSPNELNNLKTKLEQTKAKLESKDQAQIAALTREDLLGDLFRTGTVGYEPNVTYFFGTPKAITPGGVAFDIPLLNVTGVNDGDPANKKQFVLQAGILSSALEHAVPEQMFTNAQNPSEAISAVKAIQKASASGQRIYHITPANQAAILPNIHHDADTMHEIRNALNAGKEVITHTDKVSVPGWSGAGYIITDPDIGAGAYKIAGGGNGGLIILSVFLILGSVILWGIFAGGAALIIAGFAGYNFYTFAERIKNIAKIYTSPDDLFNTANQAAIISMITLLFSFLGAAYTNLGVTEAWIVNIFGSIFTGLFASTWFG